MSIARRDPDRLPQSKNGFPVQQPDRARQADRAGDRVLRPCPCRAPFRHAERTARRCRVASAMACKPVRSEGFSRQHGQSEKDCRRVGRSTAQAPLRRGCFSSDETIHRHEYARLRGQDGPLARPDCRGFPGFLRSRFGWFARAAEGDIQPIGQRNGLEDGAELVVSVRHAGKERAARGSAWRKPERAPFASFVVLEQGKDVVAVELSRPPRKVNSTTNATPATVPPKSSTSRVVAFAVPPVARRSSTISTREPSGIASL